MTRTITIGILRTYIFLSYSRPFLRLACQPHCYAGAVDVVPYTADDDVVTTTCELLQSIVYAKRRFASVADKSGPSLATVLVHVGAYLAHDLAPAMSLNMHRHANGNSW